MGKQDVDRELDVMFSSLFDALRPSLIAMVRALQRAQERDDYVVLTDSLLREFLRHQKTQQDTRALIDERKAQRAGLIAQSPKPIDAIREISAEINIDEFFDHSLGCALHALRCVGDGIAWRTLDYDRRAIAVLGDGHRVGRLADDVGLAAELDRAAPHLWRSPPIDEIRVCGQGPDKRSV
jgi:hypothetical protein